MLPATFCSLFLSSCYNCVLFVNFIIHFCKFKHMCLLTCRNYHLQYIPFIHFQN
nr:MAG TPA: hypothetical protein [Caudoviricetes sp.]